MPHGRPRDPRKEQFWRQALRRWRQSGLSIRAYCRRHCLAEPSFYAWRRLLSERDQPEPAADAASPVTFVPLTVCHEPTPSAPPVEVILANGRRLRLPVSVAAGVVRDLLAVLEERPC
jgi:transposase-like protein